MSSGLCRKKSIRRAMKFYYNFTNLIHQEVLGVIPEPAPLQLSNATLKMLFPYQLNIYSFNTLLICLSSVVLSSLTSFNSFHFAFKIPLIIYLIIFCLLCLRKHILPPNFTCSIQQVMTA